MYHVLRVWCISVLGMLSFGSSRISSQLLLRACELAGCWSGDKLRRKLAEKEEMQCHTDCFLAGTTENLQLL